MQGPRSIPPGRRGFRRPPPSARRGGAPDWNISRAQRQEERERFRRRAKLTGLQPAPPPPTHWIYLHGFASGPQSQKAKFFQQKFASVNLPLVVPDLNVPSFEKLTVTAMLAKLDEVVAALPADARIGIIGSSLGGLVALFSAERHPKHVTRLLLMAPALGLFRTNFLSLGHTGVRKWEREGFFDIHHQGTDSAQRIASDFIHDARRYDENRLRLSIPVMIVHGTHDQVVDPHLSVVYAKHNPNVTLHLVEDDHTLVTSCTQVWEWLWREIRPRHEGEER